MDNILLLGESFCDVDLLLKYWLDCHSCNSYTSIRTFIDLTRIFLLKYWLDHHSGDSDTSIIIFVDFYNDVIIVVLITVLQVK